MPPRCLALCSHQVNVSRCPQSAEPEPRLRPPGPACEPRRDGPHPRERSAVGDTSGGSPKPAAARGGGRFSPGCRSFAGPPMPPGAPLVSPLDVKFVLVPSPAGNSPTRLALGDLRGACGSRRPCPQRFQGGGGVGAHFLATN